MKAARFRIGHFMIAVPGMAIAAGFASVLVDKDKPLIFGLVWLHVMLAALGTFGIVYFGIIPAIRAMSTSLSRMKRPGLANFLMRVFYFLIYCYLTLAMIQLTIGFAIIISALPMIINQSAP